MNKVTITLTSALLLLTVATDTRCQTINLTIDASDAPRRLFHAEMVIPTQPGRLTLYYPKWIPGNHRPTGPIADVIGIRITGNSKPIPWLRDLVDMYAFHIDVPEAVTQITVAFDYVSTPSPDGRRSHASSTPELAVINWNELLLYPEGVPTDRLHYQANLTVPTGWSYGTALHTQQASGNEIHFDRVSLTTLIDSPVLVGRYFRTINLGRGESANDHYLHIAADTARSIQITDAEIEHYRNLVGETTWLFGTRHYREYHFLLALSDYVRHGGLEHHESSDNRLGERALVDETLGKLNAELLAHEMTHSWNGKYRRPSGLSTTDYQQPMKGDLLWVYEGLTQYLGQILAVRSGLLSPEEYRERLASSAAFLDTEAGRQWRPLLDTAVSVQVLDAARDDYSDYRREEDYYPEGALIWLEADVLIRQLTRGKKSLDDFCKAFFGGASGPPEVKPYTLHDLIKTLAGVAPYDWGTFFRKRVDVVTSNAPLFGVIESGWRLIFSDTIPQYWQALQEKRNVFSFRYSLGFALQWSDRNGETKKAQVIDVVRGSPADRAGIPPATTLIGINGIAFTPEVLRDAVVEAEASAEPIQLEIEEANEIKLYRIEYHGGERFPHLIRDNNMTDLLSDILRPRAR